MILEEKCQDLKIVYHHIDVEKKFLTWRRAIVVVEVNF